MRAATVVQHLCKSCRTLCFIACFILLVIAPLCCQSAVSSSTYGRKRPSLPPADVLRPMTVAVDYGTRGTSTFSRSARSASVPPSMTVSASHSSQLYGSPTRRPSTASVSDLRSASLSTVCIVLSTLSDQITEYSNVSSSV